MPHTYRLSLEALGDDAAPPGETLTFRVTNHDDLFQILSRIRAGTAVPEAEAAEFTVGLKLFGEILLRHRGEPPFAELFPHFGAFVRKLKSHVATA